MPVIGPRLAADVARVGLGLSALLGLVGALGTLLAVSENQVQRPLWASLPEVTASTAVAIPLLFVPAAVALTIGAWPRVAATFLALLFGSLFVWEQQTYSNHLYLCLLLCLWFAISPRAEPRLLMSQLSVCYAFAGLAKVNGEFLSGDVLRGVVALPLPSGWWTPLAVATIATELTLAVGLWIPRARVAAAFLGIIFHVSIPLVMSGDRYGLASFSLTCLCLYPLFLSRSAQPLRDRDPLEHRRVAAEDEL